MLKVPPNMKEPMEPNAFCRIFLRQQALLGRRGQQLIWTIAMYMPGFEAPQPIG